MLSNAEVSLYNKQAVVARARLARGFSDEECRRFFRYDLDSCPQTKEEVLALFDDDLQAR